MRRGTGMQNSSGGVLDLRRLNFDDVQEGKYHLICLPIKLEGCEGAPARAVLIDVYK